jgi:polysaccharide deacetylase 2 family uncharacterized protein YibQ
MRGLRALLVFWAVVAAGTLGLVGTLAWLGPPPDPSSQAGQAQAPAEPPDEPPVATPEPARAAASSDPPVLAPRAASPDESAGAPPVAPEPPPLVVTLARGPVADPAIPPPDPALLERTRHGLVPRLGPENRTSIRTYARPFDREDRRPRIGIVINNMGLHAQYSDDAIRQLPGAVTLAFSPYGTHRDPPLERARARGMETLIALPLEPEGFGQQADPGPSALLTTLPAGENQERLEWALSRIQGQVGAIGGLGRMGGERYAANGELLATLQTALTRRGLLYVDPRPGAPQPERAFGRSVDLLLDEPSAVRAEVERRLAELEALARRHGSALGLAGNPVPSVISAIVGWSAGLEERGAVIAPVTVLIRRPAEQAAR